MQTKNIILFIVIVLVIFGVFYSYNYFKNNPQVLAPTKQVTGLTVQDKKITDSTKPFKIDATYPYIAGQDAFNKLASDYINSQIADFKNNSLQNDNAVKETDPTTYAQYPRQYDFMASYEKGLTNENIISVVIQIYSFTGGAHGATTYKQINYDVKNKKEIKLADIFVGQKDYLQKISDFCVADLTKQINEKAGEGSAQSSWISDGAGPKEENFSVFLINKDNIIIYFPQYQVAAYALGSFTVIMPR